MERRRPGQRRGLTAYRAYELLSGQIFYPNQGYDGYGDGKATNLSDFVSEQMRADWLANREALLEVWGSDKDPYDFFPWKPWLHAGGPEALPWAERQFGVGARTDKQPRATKKGIRQNPQ